MALWRRVIEHRAMLQLADRCPFGVFKRCTVPGCDSREYIVFDERSQFMRFAACNHEVCRNCEKQVTQTGPDARREHNRQCLVTLGSQLVRKNKSWTNWQSVPAYKAAVGAMHKYVVEVVGRRQRLECPRCGVTVAKTGSCNHIVCECGEHLCQCCHRRLADRLPHSLVKAANAHAVAPYGTYVAVDEMAMVPNHFERDGWKRQEPQKRLCPRLFSQVAEWFPTALDGSGPAPGQSAPVGLDDDAASGDQVELNRHSQAVRLRVLALLLNRRVISREALEAVVAYDRECGGGGLMELWPSYPELTCHELMYVMWEWGRVDMLRPAQAARYGVSPGSAAAQTLWIFLPRAMVFNYDARAAYGSVNVMARDVFSESGGEAAALAIPSLRTTPRPAAGRPMAPSTTGSSSGGDSRRDDGAAGAAAAPTGPRQLQAVPARRRGAASPADRSPRLASPSTRRQMAPSPSHQSLPRAAANSTGGAVDVHVTESIMPAAFAAPSHRAPAALDVSL